MLKQIEPTPFPSSAELHNIGRDGIDDVWPYVLPFIEQAMDRSHYDKPEDVYIALDKGTAQLWLAAKGGDIEAVCVTQIQFNAKGADCSIWICTGHDRQDWQHHLAEIEAWAKHEGCNMMRHMARPGWTRILKPMGYAMTHVLLEKEI